MTAAATTPTTASPPAGRVVGAVLMVDIDRVKANPRNVRLNGLGDLTELVASIRAEGIIQPLVVEDAGDGTVRVIAGHRRRAAARELGLRQVPCVVLPAGNGRRTRARMLIENLHRRALEPMDEARAYRDMLDDGLTRGQVAVAVGVTVRTVNERLALLTLPAEAQRMVERRQLPLQQAGQLAKQIRRTGGRGAVAVHAARAPQHFAGTHPLAEAAHVACDLAGHPAPGRLGGACGACWEQTIRDDERARVAGRSRP